MEGDETCACISFEVDIVRIVLVGGAASDISLLAARFLSFFGGMTDVGSVPTLLRMGSELSVLWRLPSSDRRVLRVYSRYHKAYSLAIEPTRVMSRGDLLGTMGTRSVDPGS